MGMLTVGLVLLVVVLFLAIGYTIRRGHMFYVLWENERAGNAIMRERLIALEGERQEDGDEDARGKDSGAIANNSIRRNSILRGRVGQRDGGAEKSGQ